MENLSYNNIEGNRNHYNSNGLRVQHKTKWKVKEEYKEVYKIIGEGILFLGGLLATGATMFILFL